MNVLNTLRFVLLAGVAACAASARADYWLNWRADETNPYKFDYAMVAVDKGSGYSDYLKSMTVPDADAFAADDGGYSHNKGNPTGTTVVGSGTAADDYQFRVELYNMDGELLAASSSINWANAIANSYGTVDVMHPAAEAWVATGFHTVPEPTSGMLFLLGLASLALRRKRV